jgi:hypothetical protein
MGVKYCGISNLEKVGFYYYSNLPQCCYITLAPGDRNWQLIYPIFENLFH